MTQNRGKQIRNHNQQHMPIPPLIKPSLIMTHTQKTHTLLKTLLNRPTHSSQPIKYCLHSICGSITYEIFYSPIFIATNIDPYRCSRQKSSINFSTTISTNTLNVSQGWTFGSLCNSTPPQTIDSSPTRQSIRTGSSSARDV